MFNVGFNFLQTRYRRAWLFNTPIDAQFRRKAENVTEPLHKYVAAKNGFVAGISSWKSSRSLR